MRHEENIFLGGIKMFNKSNILKIIKDHEKEMAEIRIELMKADSDIVKKELRRKLGLLEDDLCRYKLQAKRWGIEV